MLLTRRAEAHVDQSASVLACSSYSSVEDGIDLIHKHIIDTFSHSIRKSLSASWTIEYKYGTGSELWNWTLCGLVAMVVGGRGTRGSTGILILFSMKSCFITH